MANLKIISFNCKGFKNRNYDFLKDVFDKCDILLIQESWLFDFEIKNVTDVLSNSSCIGISAMKDCDIGRQGRPFGGCLIVYKRNLAIPVNKVATSSSRLCVASLTNEYFKILVISVYMPVDDNSNVSFIEYGEIMNEMSGLLKIYNDFTIIIGGDFNTDFKRQSLNLNLLNNFITVESLICSSLIFEPDFTFENSFGARSTIDHFILSENVFNDIIDFKVLDEGNNLSDHCPIFISLSCTNEIFKKSKHYIDKLIINYKWHEASDEHLNNYKETLDILLEDIILPAEVSNCADKFCTGHTDQILSYFRNIVNIMSCASRLTIPNNMNKITKFNKNNKRPGWNMFVKQYKDSAISWHKEWSDAGRPSQGHLFNMRKQSRSQYHEAINFIKKNKDWIVKLNIANALKYKNYSDFWKEIRNIKGVNNGCSVNIIDNVIGDVNISNLFKERYDRLYNEFDNDFDSFNVLYDDINCICCSNKCKFSHNVTADDVKFSIKNLKLEQKDPIHQVFSNNLINGSSSLFFHLAMVFQLMINHGIVDASLSEALLVPIPKDKRKSLFSSNNYRAIALSSTVGKAFEYIILSKLKKVVCNSECQFGYKNDTSTITCSFILNQVIQYYQNGGSNVFCLFLDASKAFDRVRHDKLFECLREKNICPLLNRIITNMYKLNSGRVIWNGYISEKFYMKNGVKQGAVLSPFLFGIYLDFLLMKLNNCGVGCYIGKRAVNALAYADDLVLVAPTLQSMNTLLNITVEYGHEFSVIFNPDKSFILCYPYHTNFFPDINLVYNNIKIKVIKECKHLGFFMNDTTLLYDFKNISKDMSVKTNVLKSNFNYLDSESKIQLFNSHCMSLYGCELWSLHDPYIRTLEITWKKCIRNLLNLPSRTRSFLLPHLINTLSIVSIIENRQINFIIKGLNHSNTYIQSIFQNSLVSNKSYVTRNVNEIINKHKLSYCSLFSGRKIKLNSMSFDNCWKIKIIKEILHMRDFSLFDVLNYNEINTILNFLCL